MVVRPYPVELGQSNARRTPTHNRPAFAVLFWRWTVFISAPMAYGLPQNAWRALPARRQRSQQVIKCIGLIRRKPGVSREEFFRHWRDDHGPLAMKIPEFGGRIRKYVQIHRTDTSAQSAEARYNQSSLPIEYDGAVELWFDSLEDMEKAFRALSDPMACKELRADEDTFIDNQNTLSLMVGEEFVIYERK
jgi:uncharacterized protein (TIGR02118 family)